MTGQTGQTDNGQIAYTANRFTNGRPKTAEPIEMPFGLWTRVGPRKHVLDGFQIVMHRKNNFLWEKTCPGMPDDPLSSAVQKLLNRFGFGHWWAQETMY